MANPVNVTCTKDAWTKVITAKTAGTIINKNTIVNYIITTRATGQPAPTLTNEGRRAFVGCVQEVFSSSDSTDVYIYAMGRAGLVEVTL